MMRVSKTALGPIVALAAVLPGVAYGQAYSCSAPGETQRVRPDLPSDREPARVMPVASYTLAITWAPQYCRDNGDRPGAAFQCGAGNQFGFTLHGLWPDGAGKTWPQYCRATPIVPQAVIKGQLCSTPSAQLIQHEWAKHGTCMPGYQPARYFQRSSSLYARLRYPDMAALSRTALTAGGLAKAMAGVNPGLDASMMRITTTKQGRLDEIWICLDTRFRYRRCPAHAGGVTSGTPIEIWRGGR